MSSDSPDKLMSSAIRDVLDILDLEPLEVNLFRGRSPQVGWQRVFGGQVIGQALVAACRTVDDRPPHSLHAYFLLAGDPRVPIIYEVDRIRDGKSFTTRRVVAIQHGHAIFTMQVSFHVDEPALDHQAPMPDVPGPEDLPGEVEVRERIMPMMPDPVRSYYERERAIEDNCACSASLNISSAFGRPRAIAVSPRRKIPRRVAQYMLRINGTVH